jgi:hypothetical protein
MEGINALQTYEGIGYRTGGEYFNIRERGTAADVIRWEQEELNNTFDLIDDDIMAALDLYDADDVVWVTRKPSEAVRYAGRIEEYDALSDTDMARIDQEIESAIRANGFDDRYGVYTEDVSGGKILDDLDTDGYLVLRPEARPKTKEVSNAKN